MSPLRRPRSTLASLGLGLGFLAALALHFLGWRWFWAWETGFSVVTCLAYGYDKLAANRGWQRIPELVLHLLALSGGVAGAWVGRSLFRHKTKHVGFTVVLILATVLHLALGCWIVRQGL